MSRDGSMPFCPTCKRNTHVKSHGFNSNHIGRLIIGLKQNYYIITQRYKCLSCEARKKELQNELQRNDPQTKEKVKLKYTFMVWDHDSLPLQLHDRRDEFPVFFTWQAGLNLTLIDMI